MRPEAADAVVYHDCAELGRRLGIYDPPRAIIEKVTGKPALEFYWSRQHAQSSGAGSSMYITEPVLSAKIAAKTLEGLPSRAVTTIATACPNCLTSFQRAVGRIDRPLRVVDVVELAAEKLERAK